jgi:excisionase family DNA binding protein
MAMAIGNLLETQEAAEVIGVSPGRIYQLVNEGRITPSKRIGISMLFEKSEVERFKKIPRIMGRPKKSAKKRG